MGRQSVEPSIDSQGPGQSARSGDRIESADENGRRISLRAGHQVEHFVDPINQVDVPDTTRTEHDRIAWRRSPAGVTGFVIRSIVGFDFGDNMPAASPAPAHHQGLSEKETRKAQCVRRRKFFSAVGRIGPSPRSADTRSRSADTRFRSAELQFGLTRRRNARFRCRADA